MSKLNNFLTKGGSMKKITALILALCLACMALTACGSDDTVQSDAAVVGTWAEDFFDSGYIFNEDLTGTDTFWDMTFTYIASDGIITITYDEEVWGKADYTYSISGDSLTMQRISDDEETQAYTYTKVTDEGETGESDTAESDTSAADPTATIDTPVATEN